MEGKAGKRKRDRELVRSAGGESLPVSGQLSVRESLLELRGSDDDWEGEKEEGREHSRGRSQGDQETRRKEGGEGCSGGWAGRGMKSWGEKCPGQGRKEGDGE